DEFAAVGWRLTGFLSGAVTEITYHKPRMSRGSFWGCLPMPVIPKIEKVRVFAIESPSALDFLANRTESQTLQAVCKLLGHEFASTIVRSIGEFETALNHITSINPDHLPESERRRPLCLHIAAHGNNDELGIGGEDLNWEGLADLLWDFFGKMKR